jgi:hypothetical protein
MANDAAMPSAMRPRYARDQDPNEMPMGNGNADPGCIDAESCMLFVQKLLDGLDGDQREAFLTMLADMLSQDAPNGTGNVPSNNSGSLDRGMRQARDSRRPPVRDNGLRKPAQDAAITALNGRAFQSRWGELTRGVETWNGYKR